MGREASEGFWVIVDSPKSTDETFALVTADLRAEDPEVALHPDDLTAVYDTTDGDHRIQGVIEVEPTSTGSQVTYGLVVQFGGVVGRFGFIRRRMAAMMQRGIAEDLVADLDGAWRR